MSMTQHDFAQVWDQLRAKKPHLSQFLESIRISRLRGIEDLQINLSYPVSVVAGPNGSGKSTVLFAVACAYDVPGVPDYSPAVLFPNLRSRADSSMSDQLGNPSFEYYFVDKGARIGMVWRRLKSWSKSFMGRKAGRQPQRDLYLRTLARTVAHFQRHFSAAQCSHPH